MAMYDEKGRILIDEIAANKDIQQLAKSKENMENALAYISQINSEAIGFSGNTGQVLVESSEAVKKQIQQLINETDTAIESIQKTIARYQTIDKKLKNTMDSFGN